uniref:Uncharacterized protein n=1 Tax=Paramoeba aestuarina TaxID=180227 RepID=A0A7S4UP82_9EUKA|mmetsp:Transcript_1965/g.2676  ORF Transcript_1965/g.2676 Transcript_1965/m.2676 type:complete len:160 (-) Transcript_1965:155-634(-)
MVSLYWCPCKTRMGLPPIIQKTDIIPLINLAWDQSFAKVRSNRKAISDRGWNPLNRALLTHPVILKTRIPETNTPDNQPQGTTTQIDPAATSLGETTPPINVIDIGEDQTTVSSITPPSVIAASLNSENGMSGSFITDIPKQKKTLGRPPFQNSKYYVG